MPSIFTSTYFLDQGEVLVPIFPQLLFGKRFFIVEAPDAPMHLV